MPPNPRTVSLRRRMLAALAVLHPFFFAAAFVLDRFAVTNSSGHELLRPLVVVLGIAGVLLLIGLAVTRRGPSSALLASTALLLLVVHPIPALVMLGVGAWWAVVGTLRRRRTGSRPVLQPADPPVTVAIGYSLILLVVAAWSSGWALVPRLDSRPDLPVLEPPATAEDIYVVLLDGYARTDTLAEEFDHDTAPFESDLAALGFTMSSSARANYNKTWLTVASLLNGQFVHDVPQISSPPASAPEQVRLAEELINAGAVLDLLRAWDYEIVSIPSPVPTTDVTRDATVRAPGNLNSLEIALVTSSLPSWIFSDQVLDFLASDARGYVNAELGLLADTAAASHDRPRLVMAHLMSPHPPFILGQQPDYLRPCFPSCKVWETTVEETGMTDEAFAARVRTQVQELNALVIDALTAVVDADPDATIILMSDHGSRHHAETAEDADEHFRILFAARPGTRVLTFPDDIAPVNVFRRILSAGHAEAPLPDLPYEAWASDWHLPLFITPHR